jgi:peptidyl-prolyl cis-trans isomerase D
MLRGIRKASSNWLGRAVMGVVLGLIAVSFAVWGIGDIFRGFGRSTVAKIGSTEITVEQFRQIYNDRLQELGRQIGRPVTAEQARALRLDLQLANQLVADAALDQRALQMRLNLSDLEIARQIMAHPNFKGPRGEFDRARFEAIIRNAGFTEPRYAAEQKRITLRRELADTVNGEMTAPKTLEQAFNRYENEQRAIDYVTFDRSKAGDIAPPTPEQIAAYFDTQKASFRAPEYRSIVALWVTPAELAKPDDVSDADARRYYDTNLGRFGTPERRQLEQIVFPTLEEAQAAAARLNNEFSFEALAKERGMTEKDLDLGLVTKAGIIDQAVADAAFSIKEGEISAPIKGTFGTTLVKVVKIEPEQIKKFEEVAAEIKQTIATDRARGEIASRHDKIEDERGGGARLTEIAQKLGLKALTIEAVDRSGLDPEGKSVSGWPSGANPIAGAFGTDVGVDNEPMQVPGGGYLWYEVLSIKPSRERNLDEVRAQVEERWRNEEVSKRLKAKADELVEKLKGGTAFADAAAADGLNLQTTFGVKRSGNPGNTLSPRLVEAIFQTEMDAVGRAEGTNPGEWVVFKLTDITVPDFDAASVEGKRIADAVRRSLSEDVITQYLQRLQTDLGASINQTALRQVTSPGGGDRN